MLSNYIKNAFFYNQLDFTAHKAYNKLVKLVT